MKHTVFASVLLVGVSVLDASSLVRAADKAGSEKTAAELLPATTIAYAELTHPKQLLDLILEHPLRPRLEKIEQVRQLLENPGFLQSQAIVGVIERQIGMTWKEAVDASTTGGFYVAFDPKTDGLVVLMKSRDQATLEKLRDTFIRLARDDAKGKGKADPVKTVEYRGVTAYSVNEAKFATFGSWLGLFNKGDLGKAIVDNYLDGASDSLAGNEHFKSARKSITGNPTVWTYLDVATVRASGAAPGLYKKKTDNPLIELLVGGMLGTLQKTPYATSSLFISQQRLALRVAAPHDPTWVSEAREYYFGPGGEGAAPPLLQPKETLFSLSTYRDFSAMWLNSPELFEADVDDGFAKANANLSTVLSGKDFGEDILGSFEPEVQIVATRQRHGEEGPIPAIKLPAFAVVFRFKDAEKMRVEFRRLFQSLIGFLNVVGAMNGQPPFDLDIEKNDDNQVVTATYLPEEDEKKSKRAKINFNFSPSVAFVEDRFIVSSTKQLARELVEVAVNSKRSSGDGEQTLTSNTQFDIDLSVVHRALDDNRKQLVAQNMLSEGRDREEAEKQIGMLMDALGLFRTMSLQLATSKKTVQVDLKVDLAK